MNLYEDMCCVWLESIILVIASWFDKRTRKDDLVSAE